MIRPPEQQAAKADRAALQDQREAQAEKPAPVVRVDPVERPAVPVAQRAAMAAQAKLVAAVPAAVTRRLRSCAVRGRADRSPRR
jgi:hypothetical protein